MPHIHPFIRKATLVACIVLMVSCGGNDSGKTTSPAHDADATVSEQTKYVQVTPATQVLPEWPTTNMVVFHVTAEPDDMHPTNGNAAIRSHINQLIHRFIIASDLKNLSVRPDLVKAMPEISADELQYTYELREEPRWDDGSPLTTEDVIFTFKANKCPLTDNPHAKPYLENIKTIETDPANPQKFTIVMKRKYIQNIIFLTDYPIIQRKSFDPDNVLAKYTFEQFDDKSFNPDKHQDLNKWATGFNNVKYSREPKYITGLGAYQLVSWESQQSMTLARKKRHWTQTIATPSIYDASYPEKIIFKINKDDNSQMLEFKSQTLDVTTSLATKILLDLQKDAKFNTNYHSRFVDTYNFSYMGLNMKPDGIKHKKLFTDQKVRRAMAHLVPVDKIIKVIAYGKATRQVSMVSPLAKEYNTELKPVTYDVEAAKKLLEDAGWKDTDGDNVRDKMIDGQKVKFSFELSYMTGPAAIREITLLIAESMQKAGVQVAFKPLEFDVFYDNARKHDFDAMMGSWATSSLPEDFTQLWHTSSWASQGSNFTGFGNAATDALIDSIKYTVNEELRMPLVKKLQAMIYDEQPYVFLYSGKNKIAIHKRFGNCDMYFERPAVILNNLKLLAPGASPRISGM